MLKHVQLSPYRARAADTLSLSSNASYSSLSPEPLSSRSSSYSSLSDTHQTTTIKVYARCLRPDIEYKTLGITFQTTCHEVVQTILNKYRMRHRDPNLFYLTMEVTVRNTGVRTVIDLDKDARPAALQSCHPKGDSRFALQSHRGGLVKIYDSVLMPGSQYKSLLISERTTVDELIQILLNCYNSKERVEQFSLYEVCESQEYQRKLHPDDSPLQVQQMWSPTQEFHFLIRRNRDYRRRSVKSSWTPELSAIPCFSRLSLSQPEPSTSYPDYENYFYI
ncbi:RA domain-containing protein rau [Lycorma delicatula]|uniref:RA domain-containing protein rau n=1 Tax=Lycorma delicatula TaxID=130591 RepID=UPI003F515B50